jgi:ribosomal protein L31
MRKGIHPLMKNLTIVMRNGSSFTIQSILNRATPYMLQSDTTTHPAWTGEKAGLSMEDERISKLVKRFDGFIIESGNQTQLGSKQEQLPSEQPSESEVASEEQSP